MKELQRYYMDTCAGYVQSIESKDGHWVEFTEADAAIKELKKENEELKASLLNLRACLEAVSVSFYT